MRDRFLHTVLKFVKLNYSNEIRYKPNSREEERIETDRERKKRTRFRWERSRSKFLGEMVVLRILYNKKEIAIT